MRCISTQPPPFPLAAPLFFPSQCQSAGQQTIRQEGSFSARAHRSSPILASDGLTLGRNPKLTLDVCLARAWWGRGEMKYQKTNTPSLLLHFLFHWRKRLTCVCAWEAYSDTHSHLLLWISLYVPRWEAEAKWKWRDAGYQLGFVEE